MNFARNLKKAREHKNISRNDIASQLGITLAAYINYDNGKRNPNFNTLIKISTLLETSCDELLAGTTDRETLLRASEFSAGYGLPEAAPDLLDPFRAIAPFEKRQRVEQTVNSYTFDELLEHASLELFYLDYRLIDNPFDIFGYDSFNFYFANDDDYFIAFQKSTLIGITRNELYQEYYQEDFHPVFLDYVNEFKSCDANFIEWENGLLEIKAKTELIFPDIYEKNRVNAEAYLDKLNKTKLFLTNEERFRYNQIMYDLRPLRADLKKRYATGKRFSK